MHDLPALAHTPPAEYAVPRPFAFAGVIVTTLRAGFFTASVIPVTLGSLLARHHTGALDWGLFGWTILGILFMHAAANVSNDYFDHQSGNDAINHTFVPPFTGGSRTVQGGLISARGLLILAGICFLGFVAVAGYLTFRAGPPVLWLSIAGATTGILYTAPPGRLVARGLGELTVALDFAVLPTLGAYFVQTGTWSYVPIGASLPVAMLIVAVLVVNGLPDYEADRAVGKDTWVVRIGRKRGAVVAACLMGSWPFALLLAVGTGAPKVLLLALAGSPLAAVAAVLALRHHNAPGKLKSACAMTVLLHAGVGLTMCAGLLIL